METEPTTPVLIGARSVEQVLDEPGGGLDDAEMVVAAAEAAIVDAGIDGTVVDWIAATRGLADLADPAGRVATALGASRARRVAGALGVPQQTPINRALAGIRDGSIRVAVVCGGEAKRRADLSRRAGLQPPPPSAPGEPDEVLAPEGEIVARPEIDTGAVSAVQQYAMIENARRAAEGWSIDEHLDDVAGLWAGFNEVARSNPRAAFPAPMSAGEIRRVSPTNRLLAWPYNKWHNSQWSVDQAAALVLCSVATAEELGVPRERWVFPHVALESSLSLSLSRRRELHRWPAMRVLGDAAATHLRRPVAAVDHVELYSCFPVAVRVQQSELGIDATRVPTITGGMTFAGGPFNNFVYQATVAMVERLRDEPGTSGAVSVVSGLLTKPGLTVWSTEPPAEPVLVADLAERAAEATGVAPLDEEPSGAGEVATYTVIPGEGGPARVVAIVDLRSGARAVAALDDPDVAADATAADLIGASVHVDGTTLRV